MTDLTQSNWYQAVYDGEDDGGNPFARAASKRRCAPQRIYDVAKTLERLIPMRGKQCTSRDALSGSNTGFGIEDAATPNSTGISHTGFGPESNDRALGLTPQMEKAEHVST